MTFIVAHGFETRAGHRAEGNSWSINGEGPTSNTEKQFDGSVCGEWASNSSGFAGYESFVGTGTSCFWQGVHRLEKLPSATLIVQGAGDVINYAIKTDGEVVVLGPASGSFTTLLSTGYKLEVEKHYIFDTKLNVSAGGEDTYGLTILNESGTVVYESGDKTAAITTEGQFYWWVAHTTPSGTSYTGGGATKLWTSHFIMCDSNGASENTYIGNRKVLWLPPISDNTRDAGWRDGNSGTSNLFQSLNNAPPTGISGSTNGTKIKNAVSTTTEKYRANIRSYETAGLTGSDTIKTVQALFRISNSTATARSLGLSLISNPAVSETTHTTEGTVGTDPSGWKSYFNTVSIAPSVTLGTSPVLNIKKNAASTNTVAVDLAGIYVSYVPAAPAATQMRPSLIL